MEEAVALILGKDPEVVSSTVEKNGDPTSAMVRSRELRDQITRAVAAKSLPFVMRRDLHQPIARGAPTVARHVPTVAPADVVQWATARNIRVPTKLVQALRENGVVISDLKQELAAAREKISALDQQVAILTASLDLANSRPAPLNLEDDFRPKVKTTVYKMLYAIMIPKAPKEPVVSDAEITRTNKLLQDNADRAGLTLDKGAILPRLREAKSTVETLKKKSGT